jgi:hypothetical protein
MPSTHLSLHFHIVFSTKNRDPLIAVEWRDRLHACGKQKPSTAPPGLNHFAARVPVACATG